MSKSQFDVSKVGGSISVKGGIPLLKHLLKIVKIIVVVLNPSWVRLTVIVLRRLSAIHKAQGIIGFVKTLKVLSVLTQQSISGYKIGDVTAIGPRVSRTKSGLPRILPVGARKELRLGNPLMIKWSLTLFAIFRVVEYSTVPKIETILKPFSGSSSRVYEIMSALPRIINKFYSRKAWYKPLRPIVPSPNLSTSPNSTWKLGEVSTSPKAYFRTLLALWFNPDINKAMSILINSIPMSKAFYTAFNNGMGFIDSFLSQWLAELQPKHLNSMDRVLIGRLGKLGFKDEPAGKVRIFAMVDPWTQWVLKPIHIWIFSLLRRIPMDGTFNQLKPLDKVPFGDKPIYSFDLSAATDRLPLIIQEKIISCRFGKVFAKAWASLLVDRDYKFSHPLLEIKSVRYSVGQPMGALSSWGMLALTHHLLIQYSASIAGYSIPFNEYAILGDDMVVWNRPVASKYLSVMKGLGVDVNLSKSVISTDGLGLEFAKKTILNGKDVSPIPLKEYSAALRTSASFKTFVKKYEIPDSVIKTLLGLGYKSSINSRRWEAWKLILSIPNDYNSYFSLVSTKVRIIMENGKVNPAKQLKSQVLSIFDKIESDCHKMTSDLDNFMYGFRDPKDLEFEMSDLSHTVFSVSENHVEAYREAILYPKVTSSRKSIEMILKDIQGARVMLSKSPIKKGDPYLTMFWFSMTYSTKIALDCLENWGALQIRDLINPHSKPSTLSPLHKEAMLLAKIYKMWKHIL